jgi:hypothetical protein
MARPLSGPKITIAALNLANSVRDEFQDGKLGPLRFGLRLPNILRTMADKRGTGLLSSATVLNLQELRTCKDISPDEELHPAEIVRRICEASDLSVAVLEPDNDTDLPFWAAILYDATQVRFVGRNIFRITPELVPGLRFQRKVLMATFADLLTGRTFDVINGHFPINEQVDYAKAVCDKLRVRTQGDMPAYNTPMFYVSDLNTFFDKKFETLLDISPESVGDFQLRVFMRAGWEICKPLSTQTFRSFPQDEFQGTSRLDHVLHCHTTHTCANMDLVVEPVSHAISDHACIGVTWEFVPALPF